MDIHFCDGKKHEHICSKKNDCKRYVLSLNDENWSEGQAFFNNAPFVQKLSGVSCEFFKKIDLD